jgi:class 3 adenylate cyclase/predicted ATPase
MPPVREWLASLGFAEYADSFAENRIDLSILPALTDEDLRELGVARLGDRRRMLRAIADLPETVSVSLQRMPPQLKAGNDGERRQVTVMFADLVNSTALSASMDPEDVREIISAYQQCVAETVHRFDGYVARYVGDGALIYFGYPRAHEDDAERAVGAGLELIVAVTNLHKCPPQKIRAGIATGLVVVGHLISSGESEERGIVGETPNLAARLQGIAEANAIVVAETTRRLVGDLFIFQDLGLRELKGIAGPIRAWAVLQPNSVASRFEALHATGMTALVGREKQIDLLLQCWRKAKKGKGQVVLLSGEAGIGKSRLTATVMELLAKEQHTRLRYFCSPQHTNSAFHPIVGQMERAAAFARGDTLNTKLDKLDAILRRSATSVSDTALIAEMLSLPNDGRYPLLDLDPRLRRQKTLEALIRQMKSLSRSAPVLMIFEDAHWADPTSLEVFDRVIREIASHRVLLIMTFRMEFERPWIGHAHVSAITLNRLAPSEAGVMINHIASNKQLLESVRHDIIERTDGIPLFVEEMTKAVLEAECEGKARRTAASVPSPALAVPASLQASLMARLDRLGVAKELTQIGAAIGREFSHTLLAAVAGMPEAKVRRELERAIRAGLLFRQGDPPNANYLFKHALVQDAAYGLLLREPMRKLHEQIAEILESKFCDIIETKPELLARHCFEAGQIEKAAKLWGKAGHRSAQRSALVEAREQLSQALHLIATLSDSFRTPALRRDEIELQVALITPLLHISGYASPETRAAVERGRELIEQAGALGEPPEDPLCLFSVLYASWVANLVAFDGDVVRELAIQFLDLAEKQSTTGPLMIGHRLVGLSLLHIGDIPDGREHLDRAFALYNSVEHRPLAVRFGQDVGAATLSWRSIAFWLLGYPQISLADTDLALKIAREIGHSATLLYVLNFSVWTHIHRGNFAPAAALIDEFAALKDQTNSSFWAAWGMMQQGCIFGLTGKTSDAVQTIATGVTAMRSTGTTMWMPVWLSNLAAASAKLGQFDDAERLIREAVTAMETTKERWYAAEVYRIAGEIALLSEPDVAKGAAHIARALAIARHQQAKSWELRAATSMARLWHDQGRRQQAHDLLAPVHSWFTEGFDTLDLIQAKRLLDQTAE